MEKEKILKEIEEKAKKKGWIQGKHIFNYLNESDMHKYDTIKSEIERKKIIKEVLKKIDEELEDENCTSTRDTLEDLKESLKIEEAKGNGK